MRLGPGAEGVEVTTLHVPGTSTLTRRRVYGGVEIVSTFLVNLDPELKSLMSFRYAWLVLDYSFDGHESLFYIV